MWSQSRQTAEATHAVPHCRILYPLLKHVLLLGTFGISPLALYAQEEPVNFDLLIFDAVPLAMQPVAADPDSATTGESDQFIELVSPPRNNPQPVSVLARQHAIPAFVARDSSSATARDVTRYEAALKAVEQKGNAYDLELTETLMGLAASYEDTGDYASALPLYERASHITRVNHGLFSLEQVPIIERVIANQVARGDLLAADQQQEYLFYLHRRIHGDNNPDMLPIMQKFAEWNMYAYRARILVPRTPPEDEASGSAPSSTRKPPPVEDLAIFRIQRLFVAQAVYEDMIKLLLTHFGPNDPRLPPAERSLAVANYLYATQVTMTEGASGWQTGYYNSDLPIKMLGFTEGREALERRVQYLERAGDKPLEAITQAKIELGDWLMTSRKRMNAIELYTQTHADYVASGASPEAVDALFHPAMPARIPTFVISPYSRESLSIPEGAALQYRGYVDVEFSVSRYGQTGNVRELARSAETPPRIVDTLLRKLRREQFRPRFRDGKILQEDRVRARYYYAY